MITVKMSERAASKIAARLAGMRDREIVGVRKEIEDRLEARSKPETHTPAELEALIYAAEKIMDIQPTTVNQMGLADLESARLKCQNRLARMTKDT